MDDVSCSSGGRLEFFETDDIIRRSPSSIADTLDLAVRRPTSTVHVRPLERLSGRWTFLSMPQDINLAAYGKQFSGEWPSFHAGLDCDMVNAVPPTTTAPADDEETQDGCALQKLSGPDAKNSSTPNTFARQCVAFAGLVFSWDFCRTFLFFLPIDTFQNRR